MQTSEGDRMKAFLAGYCASVDTSNPYETTELAREWDAGRERNIKETERVDKIAASREP